MAFSDPDFCLCFLVKVFPRGCQIFLVSCGSSCLCLSLSISLSTSVCLSLRMCVPECPTGFFRDDKKRCKKCSPLCESCMGSRSDQCTACRPGLYLMEGGNNCVSSCPDGFYLDLGKSHTSSRSRKPQILIGCWIWDLMWLFSRRLHHVPEMQRELQEMHICEHLHWMPDRSQVIPPIHLLQGFFFGPVCEIQSESWTKITDTFRRSTLSCQNKATLAKCWIITGNILLHKVQLLGSDVCWNAVSSERYCLGFSYSSLTFDKEVEKTEGEKKNRSWHKIWRNAQQLFCEWFWNILWIYVKVFHPHIWTLILHCWSF